MNSTKTNMAAPGLHALDIGERTTPGQYDSSTREDPVPILPKPGNPPLDGITLQKVKEEKWPLDNKEVGQDQTGVVSDSEDLVMSVDTITDSQAGEANMCVEEPLVEEGSVDDGENGTPGNLVMDMSRIDGAESAKHVTQACLDTGQRTISLPLIPELLQQNHAVPTQPVAIMKKGGDTSVKIELPIKTPYKGVMVPCGKLKDYLDSLLTFNRKCMLRKGREVHKIYVDMVKGECFLDDQFSYTEFGKMVLTNGSIRAGRAKNAKQIVVARETLYCSGTISCKRACGGYGICLPGCDKTKMRGHRCAYRIKLTQRLGYVNFWFVEELGSHDQIGGGKDSDFKCNTTGGSMVARKEISSAALDLSPKASPERFIKHSKSVTQMNGGHETVSNNSGDDQNSDGSPNYHYVLGLMPSSSSSPSCESPSRSSPRLQSESSQSTSLPSQQPQTSAINVNKDLATLPVSAHSNTVLVSIPSSQIMSTAMPNLPVNVVSFMPELLSLGMSQLQNAAAAAGGFNPLLVNVKQEPGDEGQGQGNFIVPMMMPGAPIQYSPSQLAKTHSPSPSRHFRDRSPLARELSLPKVSELEEKVKTENSQKMQANQNILGQVHSRLMERARSRKSAQTVRVPQKISMDKDVDAAAQQEASLAINLSIPKESDSGKLSEEAFLSSIPSIERFQTLNRILQSDAFQAAKNQLEMKKSQLEKNGVPNQDIALNLTVKQNGSPSDCINTGDGKIKMDTQSSYFRLMQEWKKENQSEENVNNENHTDEDLDEGDTEELTDNEKELINRVRQLESHVKQLQNIVIKRESDGATSRRKKAQRDFDFNKYNSRHVALKIMYLGCDYHGFAVQEDTDKTIEQALFEALKKTRLVEARETSNYHRCGRTDKGVSAFGQVISIDLRSNLISGVGVKVREGGTAQDRPGDKTVEIRYCQILNKVLPPEIRVLAWAPVDPDFSARFSCKQRTYKYIFPKANLDIPAMIEAAQKLVGEKDYRNLCKMDVANGVTNFTRRILSTDISMLNEVDSGYSMCELTIIGSSFLWHQIRCIVAVLFLIGQGKEKLEIMDELLDVTKNPKKPQYTMAHEVPLCLYDSEFGDNFEWIYEADWHEDNIKHLQQLWAEHTVKATMLKRMLEDLDKAKVETECDIAPWSDLSPPVYNQVEWLTPGNKPRVYKPLMDRPTCESLEERLENLAKKRKLNSGAAQESPSIKVEKE